MNYLSVAPMVCLGLCAALSGVAEATIVPTGENHRAYVNRRPVGESLEQTDITGPEFVDFNDSVTVQGNGGPNDTVTAGVGLAVSFGLDADLISMAGESSGSMSGLIGDQRHMPLYGVYSFTSISFSTDQATELNLSYDYWNLGSEYGSVSSRVSLRDFTTNPDGDVLHQTRRDNETEAYSYADSVSIVVGPGEYILSFYFRGLEVVDDAIGEAFEIGTGYSFAFTAQTVPAPSGIATIGLVGLAFGRRRR
jgi:hypothetical protein